MSWKLNQVGIQLASVVEHHLAVHPNRTKRGMFGFSGEVLGSLFGVVSAFDLN